MYVILWESVLIINRVTTCTIDLICLMKFVCPLYKSNDYKVNWLYCNCQWIAFKTNGMHFVLYPKQGNKIKDVVLKGYIFSLAVHLYQNISWVPLPGGEGVGKSYCMFHLLQKPYPYKVSPIGFSQEIKSRHPQAMPVKAPWYQLRGVCRGKSSSFICP